MPDIMQDPTRVSNGKFDNRTALKPAEKKRLMEMAAAGHMPGDGDNDQNNDEEDGLPEGENGVDWI